MAQALCNLSYTLALHNIYSVLFLLDNNTPFMIFSSEHNTLQPTLYLRAKCTPIVLLLWQVDVEITNSNG